MSGIKLEIREGMPGYGQDQQIKRLYEENARLREEVGRLRYGLWRYQCVSEFHNNPCMEDDLCIHHRHMRTIGTEVQRARAAEARAEKAQEALREIEKGECYCDDGYPAPCDKCRAAAALPPQGD